MFSAGTVAQIEQRLTAFNTDTGKQVVVVTVPSLNGSTLEDAAHQTFAQQNVNGVLIFIAKDDRRDIIVPDRAGVQAGWFVPDTLAPIRQSMEAQFKAEDFDAGITSAVDGVLGIYRSHAQSLPSHAAANALPAQSAQIATQPPARGRSHGLFFWILIAVVGFLVLRMVIRAVSGPRPGMPMQTGGVPLQPGGMPMQQGGMPMQGGWGSGYGGGGFWSGMLGGLGGAFLGNETLWKSRQPRRRRRPVRGYVRRRRRRSGHHPRRGRLGKRRGPERLGRCELGWLGRRWIRR